MSELYWREPWFLLAAVYPLLLWAWGRWRQRRVQLGYADASLWPWVEASSVGRNAGAGQRLALGLAWVLLALALAGPRLPLQAPGQARPPAGALVAVLDLSRSMQVREAGRERRSLALGLLQDWNSTKNRPALGLVVYAGRAHLFFPPSPDAEAVSHFLEQLPNLPLPTLGNDLAAGLDLAWQVLQPIEGQHAIVLLSDGDLDQTQRVRAEVLASDLAAREGMQLSVIGLGSGTAAPVPDPEHGWMSGQGRPVLSRRHGVWLQQLAASAKGAYLAVGPAGALPLHEVWQAPRARIAPEDVGRVLWRELHAWAVLPAVLLLMLAFSGRLPRRAAPLALLTVAAGLTPAMGEAADSDRALDALQASDWPVARHLYGELPGYAGRFGEGVACYRQQDWACAAEAFASAAWLAADDKARGRAAFNLAAVLYQQGDFSAAARLYRDAGAHGLAPSRVEPAIEFSETLARQVEQRRAQQAVERRPAGIGPRSDDALMDRMATEHSFDPPTPSLPPLPEGMDRAAFESLVARGLDRARLDSPDGEDHTPPGRSWFGGEALALQRSGTQLWKRLFEIEEGFPASLSVPRARPGQRPW